MSNEKSIIDLAIKCANEAINEAGSYPFDFDGQCLIPNHPLPGDWEALEDLLGEPSDSQNKIFADEYFDAIKEAFKTKFSNQNFIFNYAHTGAARGIHYERPCKDRSRFRDLMQEWHDDMYFEYDNGVVKDQNGDIVCEDFDSDFDFHDFEYRMKKGSDLTDEMLDLILA